MKHKHERCVKKSFWWEFKNRLYQRQKLILSSLVSTIQTLRLMLFIITDIFLKIERYTI